MGAPIKYNDAWLLANADNHSTYASLAQAYNKQFNTTIGSETLSCHCRDKLGIVKDRRVEWDNEWLIANYLNAKSYSILADQYNEVHGTAITRSGIKRQCSAVLGLAKPKRYTEWSADEDDWLIENYSSLGVRASAEGLNNLFATGRTYKAVKCRALILGITVDKDVCTRLKIECHILPEGSLYTDPTSKRVYIKHKGDWIAYSRYLWEQKYGKVPKGHVIKYLDNNVSNNTIENLYAIPARYLGVMFRYNLVSTHPVITKAGILWCDLYTKVNNLQNS